MILYNYERSQRCIHTSCSLMYISLIKPLNWVWLLIGPVQLQYKRSRWEMVQKEKSWEDNDLYTCDAAYYNCNL
jgi:hypothetical protein